jgi:hypothetical protein
VNNSRSNFRIRYRTIATANCLIPIYLIATQPLLSSLALLRPLGVMSLWWPRPVTSALLALGCLSLFQAGTRRSPIGPVLTLLCLAIALSILVGLCRLVYAGSLEWSPAVSQLAYPLIAVVVGITASQGKLTLAPKIANAIAWCTLATCAAGAMITAEMLSSGAITRYYSPAYPLIFCTAYWLSRRSPWALITSLAVGLASNKRGVVLSQFALLVVASLLVAPSRRIVARTAVLMIAVFFLTIAMDWLLDLQLIQRVSQTQVWQVILARSEKLSLDPSTWEYSSSGRTTEIAGVIEILQPMDYLFGRGIGHYVYVPPEDDPRSYIHFSPLAFVSIFGAPLTLSIYTSLLLIGRRSLQCASTCRDEVQRNEFVFLALYVFGAVTHSLTAYSLFIDGFLWFAIGRLLFLAEPPSIQFARPQLRAHE